MIHKDANTMKPNGFIKKLKKSYKVKKDPCTCNKTILASNRNTSLNATEYSKFLFCSLTKPIIINY